MIYNFEFSSMKLMNTLSSDGKPIPEVHDIGEDSAYFSEYMMMHGMGEMNRQDANISFDSISSVTSNELSFYATIQLESNTSDYMEIGQCSSTPVIAIEFNGTMIIILSYKNKLNESKIERKMIDVALIPTGEWITVYYSVQIRANDTNYQAGFIGANSKQHVSGQLNDIIVLTTLEQGSCKLAYCVNSKLQMHSATYENEYLNINRFINQCNGKLCISLNIDYCIFAPMLDGQFYKYNVNSLDQCKCVSNTACISCVIGNYLADDRCKKCHPLCLSCSGPTNNECISCNNALQHVVMVSDKTCECNSHDNMVFDSISNKCTCKKLTIYNATLNQCETCTEQCLSCEGLITPEKGIIKVSDMNCECDSDRLFEYNASDNSCMCKESHYYNATLQKCDNCGKICTSCIDTNACTQCGHGAYLDDNKCYCRLFHNYDAEYQQCLFNKKIVLFIVFVIALIIAFFAYRKYNKPYSNRKYKSTQNSDK